VAVLASDCNNVAAAAVIYHLIEAHSVNFSKAYGLVKERRISTNIID
jgi:alpha-D-ribose 1-methylphosphonate 5-triphosphate synthase subunit PhnI